MSRRYFMLRDVILNGIFAYNVQLVCWYIGIQFFGLSIVCALALPLMYSLIVNVY